MINVWRSSQLTKSILSTEWVWLVSLLQYGSISMKTGIVLLYKNHSSHLKGNETLFILEPYMNDMCYVIYL